MDWARRATWYWLAFVVLIVGTGWIVLSRVPARGPAVPGELEALPREGFLAPDFALDTLAGRSIRLSDLQGKVVMVNFWATWCPPCRLEMPAIQEVYERAHERGFEVLAVNLQESDAHTSAFVQEMGLTFPILSDRTGSVSGTYRVISLPTTFFIDRSGVIRDIVVGGPLSRALIASKVELLLAEEAVQ